MIYLYALLDETPTAPLGEGLAGEPLHLVHHGGLLAAVGERPSPPAPGVHAFSEHDAVVRRLAGMVSAVLPARFGECFPSEENLAEKLAPQAGEIAKALDLVRGCVQMTLRVFGEPAPPAASRQEPDASKGPGARYLAQRRHDDQQARSLPEIEPLREILAPLVRAERTERHTAAPLLGTAYHLVLRDRTADYLAALEEGRTRLPDHRVQASGPWPPYAFAPGAAWR
ncbi:MAG TPA: GvpL/GvpF family gas vesicle protein [Thermoanaerobaculia bacterium]|nr:GvpL/GvpF family gas vesicle protein [Thermoanaerobaculia bacterium]